VRYDCSCGLGQPVGIGQPPYPHMGIEQDHLSPSQSSNPTGSNGFS
jgi:hypothetical protein